MSGYLEKLADSARRAGHVLCLGLDPDPGRIGDGSLAACRRHLDAVLDALESDGLRPAATKPNLAYFEQFGSRGLAWLEELLPRLRELGPVILDAKRGDIGASSRAYARALFHTWGADAVTVSPWMGHDSVSPFLEGDGGVYLLIRTSNPGSGDLQCATVDGRPLWQHLLGLVLGKWHRAGVGGVVGATRPEALAALGELLGTVDFPLLIPGVGTQGGDAATVMRHLPGRRELHRVNVSSAILYDPSPARAFGNFAAQLALAQ